MCKVQEELQGLLESKGGVGMNIIDKECIACKAFENCTTDIMKGSIMCSMKRQVVKQTKADMYKKIKEEGMMPEWIGKI